MISWNRSMVIVIILLFSVIKLYEAQNPGKSFIKSLIVNTSSKAHHHHPHNSSAQPVRPKFFVPSNLPLNREVKVYIFNEEVKRFTFAVDTKLEAPLTLTITPCSDPIKWRFEFIENPGPREPLKVRKRRRHGRRRRHRRDKVNEGQRILLTQYSGQSRRSFTDIRRQYSGQYVIELVTSDKVTTSAHLILSYFNPYPLLPLNDSIILEALSESQVNIRWNPSLSEPDYPIDYYITFNRDHHLISFCEYLEQAENTGKSNLLPFPVVSISDLNEVVGTSTMSPFALWWERTMTKAWESAQKRKVQTDEKIIHLEKSRKNSSHVITSLSPSTKYYIDVIAVNRLTKSSSLYSGLVVTTREQPQNAEASSDKLKEPRLIKLRDKRLTSVELNETNNFTEILSYTYSERNLDFNGDLWLFVQTCPSSGKVNIIAQGQSDAHFGDNAIMIKETGVSGIRTISIPSGLQSYNSTFPSLQKILIQVTGAQSNMPLEVALMATKKRSAIPYPQLPRDRTIRVLDLLTNCNSVSLAWIASNDEKARYCLYAGTVSSDVTAENWHRQLAKITGHSDQQCSKLTRKAGRTSASMSKPSSSPGNLTNLRRLMCRRYRRFSKNRLNQVIMQKVRGLDPSTEYVFLIEIAKPKGISAYYDPLTTSTKSRRSC